MQFTAVAVHLLIGAGLGHVPGEIPAWALPGSPPAVIAEFKSDPRSGGENPACRAEFCQPRVSIPGREQGFDTRGKRTEIALAAIDRMRLGAVSTVARAANTAGVRVDYQPPQLDALGGLRGGFGKLNVGLRWRLDAWGGPTWLGPAP